MKNRKEWRIDFLKKTLLALTSLFLFLPMIQIFSSLNKLEDEGFLFLFLILISLLALFIPFWYLYLSLQLVTVLYTYHHYFPIEETGWDWIKSNVEQQVRSINQFLQGDLAIFPTTVALLLILLFIALSSYLLINRKKPTLAILTCLIYFMILHVFTTYDFFSSIVQILGVSILIIGISQIPSSKGWRVALLSFLVISIAGLFFTRTAFWMTENLTSSQQWVEGKSRNFQRELEKNGFFDWLDYYSSGGGLKRMGYGENDSTLGGPLQQNFGKVFLSQDDAPHYWLISTKDTYTGKGWEQSENMFSFPIEGTFMLPSPEQKIKEFGLNRIDSFDYIPYPYQTIDMYSEEGTFFMNLPANDVYWEGSGDQPNDFILTITEQDIDISALSEVELTSESIEEAGIYLELPDNIPNRVWDLATSITADEDRLYDKVRAIEEYLHSGSSLRYSLREAAYLPEGEEYVDHFLFESKVGYCDNFSTSMVVMSRMLGIPARWAKGFNSGVRSVDVNEKIYYEITNANAHSWPEIYFPEYGWVPFEPTPAFIQPLTSTEVFTETTMENNKPELDLSPLEEREDREPDSQESIESILKASDIQSESTVSSKGPKTDRPISEHSALIKFFILLILVLSLIFFLFRKRLYSLIIQQLIAFPFLSMPFKTKMINSLFQITVHKSSSQTIRQYFNSIENKLPMHKQVIQDFILLNETLLYAPTKDKLIHNSEDQNIVRQMIVVFQDLQTLEIKSSF